jgi:23S rRNA U2552 (ribose-2'-O)-methylase RlmE/FtsJ
MSYFLLPPINNILEIEHIKLLYGTNDIIISKSLCYYLNLMKTQIDNYTVNWDIYKKYTNVYEYIHTTIPYTKQSICKLKPLSRSFYKFVEIYNLLNILDSHKSSIKTFHLAEGPGGFIEAIEMLRANSSDIYYGMTLIDNDENIPGWKKSKYFLSKHPNIIIEKGADNTGNLFNVENLWHCYTTYKNSMDLITGDGGFDFSIDFNKQEVLSINLIFCQICYAIAVQKKGGTFILKFFDIFTEATTDLIYILSTLYEKIHIIKPYTSRIANSERYVVCKNFKLNNTYELIKCLSKLFPLPTDKSIQRFLNIDIPYLLINKLEDINAIIGQQQLENILGTLYLLDNNKTEKMDAIKKTNIQKCVQWCIKHKLPYNKNIQQLNVFLT